MAWDRIPPPAAHRSVTGFAVTGFEPATSRPDLVHRLSLPALPARLGDGGTDRRIDDLLDMVGKARYFTSLDLASGYHQIRIPVEDRPKTAFRTPLGHYQWKVLVEGLTNAPSTFQRLMNDLFEPYIGKFVAVYLDDILVFSSTKEEHYEHLQIVLDILHRAELYCKIKKCTFMAREVKFLGHIVDERGLRPDPDKVAVVKDWPVPTCLKELRSFLGLCNYFRKFIRGYAHLVFPITELLKTKKPVKPKR